MTIYRTIRDALMKLNLFETASAHQDPFELKTTQITTRIYLGVLLLALFVITSYIAVTYHIETKTVDHPSDEEFLRLWSAYPNTLLCPCSDGVIPYESFVSISPVYHPLCSSFLVSREWMNAITAVNKRDLPEDDLRYSASMIFNTLSTLCSLANTTVYNAWQPLARSFLVSDNAWSENSLRGHIDLLLQRFQQRTESDFKRGILITQTQIQHTLVTQNGNIE
jgi:hypothetical protein